MPKFDFQRQFSTSKIIRIFLSLFFIEEYQFRGMFLLLTFFENFDFWSTLFTKIMLIFKSIDLELMLTWQKKKLWKSVFYHSIKLPFDAEAAEKIINVTCCWWRTCIKVAIHWQSLSWRHCRTSPKQWTSYPLLNL